MNGTIADGARLALAGAALMGAAPEAASAAELQGSFPIVELRQYTLHDGKRDVLIDLFEREFVESQEALGMKVIGTFTDIDRPNRFVWLRGFRDMDSRLAGLTSFYGGPVWQGHRNEANATMVDSDNVLLLHAPDHAAEPSFTLVCVRWWHPSRWQLFQTGLASMSAERQRRFWPRPGSSGSRPRGGVAGYGRDSFRR